MPKPSKPNPTCVDENGRIIPGLKPTDFSQSPKGKLAYLRYKASLYTQKANDLEKDIAYESRHKEQEKAVDERRRQEALARAAKPEAPQPPQPPVLQEAELVSAAD